MSLTFIFSRCNPEDPEAVKGYRPRVTRASVQKMLGGISQGILDSANREEDALSARFAQAQVSGAADNNNNNNNNNTGSTIAQ